jgi:hypothetical protein
MTKHEFYFNLYQITGNPSADAPIEFVDDFNRELSVLISRNSETRISGINIEFCGPKTRFHCSILPDGDVLRGMGLNTLSMPRVKLSAMQRGLALLSCIQFLNDSEIIKVDFDYYKDRISTEVCHGNSLFKQKYDSICYQTKLYLEINVDVIPDVPENCKLTAPEFYAF